MGSGAAELSRPDCGDDTVVLNQILFRCRGYEGLPSGRRHMFADGRSVTAFGKSH